MSCPGTASRRPQPLPAAISGGWLGTASARRNELLEAQQTDGGHTAVELLATERLQSMATRTSEVAAPTAPRAASASIAAAAAGSISTQQQMVGARA